MAAVSITKVLVANPRGFCAGVVMAVETLVWTAYLHRIRFPGQTVYCRNQIIHNEPVVRLFERLDVKFVREIEEVPVGATLVLSAHGTAPQIIAAAEARGLRVTNAICPLVLKVHREVEVAARRGARIIYFGDAHHDEPANTIAIAPEAIWRVESAEDVWKLPDVPQSMPLVFLSQTTRLVREYHQILMAVRARFPWVESPRIEDICFATENRQAALEAILARDVDSVVVIGSKTSFNTASLVRVVQETGVAAWLVDGSDELPELSGIVGVTAGASAPEFAVQGVLRQLDPTGTLTESVAVTVEEQRFQIPESLRAMLTEEELKLVHQLDPLEFAQSLSAP